jgi:hypothetical protein
MQYPLTWNPDEAYRLIKDISLRLAYVGSVVRSHMEGDIKVIEVVRRFGNLSPNQCNIPKNLEVPGCCRECGYPAFGCPFIRGSEACAIRREQWVKSDAG